MGMCKPSGGIGRSTGGVGDLDWQGEPNTRIDLFNKNGDLLTQRWYGPSGRALMNRDWKHADEGKVKHKFPHDHPWDWSKRKPRLKYEEKREINENFC